MDSTFGLSFEYQFSASWMKPGCVKIRTEWQAGLAHLRPRVQQTTVIIWSLCRALLDYTQPDTKKLAMRVGIGTSCVHKVRKLKDMVTVITNN